MNTSTREEQFAIKDWLASHGFSALISLLLKQTVLAEKNSCCSQKRISKSLE